MNSLKNHLLISVPHMNDDIFCRSVIYICEHNLEGAFGLIINKPLDNVRLEDLKKIDYLNSDYKKDQKTKLHFGGPILVEKIMALHSNELNTETAIKLNNKISISSGKEIIRNIEKNINVDYKLFCGHSGWSPGQLEKEIKNGDWLLQNSKIDLLFNLKPEKIWENATQSLGINIMDISNISGST